MGSHAGTRMIASFVLGAATAAAAIIVWAMWPGSGRL